MQGQMTYKRARKLNAIFLLLLLATDIPDPSETDKSRPNSNGQGMGGSPEYFKEKLKEFEREKYRF